MQSNECIRGIQRVSLWYESVHGASDVPTEQTSVYMSRTRAAWVCPSLGEAAGEAETWRLENIKKHVSIKVIR